MFNSHKHDATVRTTSTWANGVVAGVLLLMLVAGYFGAYRALVVVAHALALIGTAPATSPVYVEIVHYRHVSPAWQPWCRTVFSPAEWLDRQIRPDFWKAP